MYQDVNLFIAGRWTEGSGGTAIPVVNPATDQIVGHVAQAETADLAQAVAAAEQGFHHWRKVSALERSRILRRAADILRERIQDIAEKLTIEQGKPLGEARAEILASADIIDWFAEEGRRAYGRVIPARTENVQQIVVKEAVGPVAAFTPWNFPVAQAVRKLAAALAAGCSVVIKGPEDTPASPAELVRAFVDAGVPDGVINLVYGVPAQISGYLIPHPSIRKVSFTGSVPVGKQLAAMAGQHMKRATMELGGHSPAMIFDDADIDVASRLLAASKFRNAGQVCTSPTRFLIQDKVFDRFCAAFATEIAKITVGDGQHAATTMGPLVSRRRQQAIESLIDEAVSDGAKIAAGAARVGNGGAFYAPTMLTEVNIGMRIMNDEPFGPVALMMPFHDIDDLILEANRLPYGLAAYAFTRSMARAQAVSRGVETGMITLNHLGLALPEVPFGGVKDSGYGSEGGSEALEAYLTTKFVTTG